MSWYNWVLSTIVVLGLLGWAASMAPLAGLWTTQRRRISRRTRHQ